MTADTEVAVIGAGPAGMWAAITAARSGCHVTLIDAYARPGGQYYKQMPRQFKASAPNALHHDFGRAEAVMAQLQESNRVTILSGTSVWSAHAASDKITLYLNNQEGSSELYARTLVLTPGAYDRALPFPGWDLPGVMTAGAMQTLVKSQRVLPGRRIVLSGSGPFLMPVAAALAEAGADVLAVYEATHPRRQAQYGPQLWGHWDKLLEAQAYLRILARHRVPVKFGRAVVRAEGDGQVRRVAVARLNADWSPRADSEEYLDVDALGIGYGFVPSTELSYLLGCEHRYDSLQGAFFARHSTQMASSRKGIFVAGEITGIGGSSVARLQGTIAGYTAARWLTRLTDEQTRAASAPYMKQLRHQQAFASLLHSLYRVRPGWQEWLTSDTVICRCEEVSYGKVEEAVTQFGASDVKTVKSLTRCGMGLCQGRVCGPNVTAITAALSNRSPEQVGALSTRPIVKPITLGALIEAAPQTPSDHPIR
ncbi:MAG: NAD(P)/FAD-dependent oxidoreductase [Chloroflexota bacterium]